MKRALPLMLLLASPALAQEQATPNRLTLGQGSTIQLQGWTRLNGTADFATATKETDAPVVQTEDDAARRARLLEAEAAYQKQKKSSESGW